jgi:hypothetical protein
MRPCIRRTIRGHVSRAVTLSRTTEAKAPVQFYAERINSLEDSLTYYTEAAEKERSRVADSTQWLRNLRASLDTRT